jgi:hypothetical protein
MLAGHEVVVSGNRTKGVVADVVVWKDSAASAALALRHFTLEAESFPTDLASIRLLVWFINLSNCKTYFILLRLPGTRSIRWRFGCNVKPSSLQ